MQRLTVTVRAEHVEPVLDRLLASHPEGVHVLAAGEHTRLVVEGADLAGLAGREERQALLVCPPTVEDVPDDWRERRRSRYVPRRYGDRLVVRPSWATPGDGSLLEVVLDERDAAFGSGEHPTTRACLELLCRLEPEDSLADLGCGSGVLAIAAAKLGWPAVHAVDVDPRSVRAAAANAMRNGVAITTSTRDLTREAPPPATLTLANVPAHVHTSLQGRLTSRTVVATGIESARLPEVAEAYGRNGYRTVVAEEMLGWALLVLERAP